MIARSGLNLPAGRSANLLRGQFGKALRQACPELYDRLFAPRADSGPSGLRNSPRPFVLRVRQLDGMRLAPGDTFEIGVNLFERQPSLVPVIRDAICAATTSDCTGVEGVEPLRLSLEPAVGKLRHVRVRFLTPTELKPAGRPDFAVLFARIRDRVSTLRALYGSGPLTIDFRALGDRAAAVTTTHCEFQHIDAERVSRSTGQRHSLGGFVGFAQYEGDLAGFVPYLEIARWTGVGRQTVWGKGEIAWETV
jgi:CRISPR-associated endoribonuclease Cas6